MAATEKQGTLETTKRRGGESTARKSAASTRRLMGPSCKQCGGSMLVYKTELPSKSYPQFLGDQRQSVAITRVQRFKCDSCGRTAKFVSDTPEKI